MNIDFLSNGTRESLENRWTMKVRKSIFMSLACETHSYVIHYADDRFDTLTCHSHRESTHKKTNVAELKIALIIGCNAQWSAEKSICQCTRMLSHSHIGREGERSVNNTRREEMTEKKKRIKMKMCNFINIKTEEKQFSDFFQLSLKFISTICPAALSRYENVQNI